MAAHQWRKWNSRHSSGGFEGGCNGAIRPSDSCSFLCEGYVQLRTLSADQKQHDIGRL
jgi:hypothetical protein